jgi:adenosylhomocysteine nucleosidase
VVSREPVLLIVAAEAQELAPLALALGATERPDVPVRWGWGGLLKGHPVVLAANGAGRENAARAVREVCDRWAVRGIVSTGWCGALEPELRIGDIVIADRVLSLKPAAEFPVNAPVSAGTSTRGGLVTVDHFVGAAEEKRALRSEGAIAVDMEAAGVAAEARERELPLFCVRVVSDRAERSFEVDFNRARRSDGGFSGGRIAAMAGFKPSRWRELVGFWQDTRLAAKGLAGFLGECRFEV